MPNNYHIKTNNLSWSATSSNSFKLEAINFQARRSQFIGLLGPNGSGKTTFLRCLYRGLNVASTMIEFDGKALNDYKRLALAKKMAVVFQQQPEEITLTVDEVLKLGRIPHQQFLSPEQSQLSDYENQLIEELDISHMIHRPYRYLSGGEKQRVMIARALIQKPEILLLDEPSNHLDIAHQIAVLDYIRKLDITVICSLHDLNLAAQFCDEVAVLKAGRLVKQGTVNEVLTPSLIQSVFSVNALADTHPIHGTLRLSFY